MIQLPGLETLPEKHRSRKLHAHNPQATGARLTADEMRLVAETVAGKLNLAKGPVKVFLPTRGFSDLDIEGGVFWDPVADRAFIETLRNSLNRNIEVKEINANLNDETFAKAVAEEAIRIVK